jgi:hypothetical protein
MRLYLITFVAAVVLDLIGAEPSVAGPNLRVLETGFQSLLTQPDGSVIARSTATIPLIPATSCFQWTIKVDAKSP